MTIDSVWSTEYEGRVSWDLEAGEDKIYKEIHARAPYECSCINGPLPYSTGKLLGILWRQGGGHARPGLNTAWGHRVTRYRIRIGASM